MLLAEDLLLLLLDDETGKPVAGSPAYEHMLAGGVLVDLVLAGAVVPEGGDRPPRKARFVVAAGATAPADPELAAALGLVAAKAPVRPDAVLGALAKGLPDRLLARLVASGDLRREESRVLRFFPVTRYPAGDLRREADVRARLTSALRNASAGTDARTAAIAALLSAGDALPAVVRPQDVGLRTKELVAAGKQLAEGDAISVAVRRAVQEVQSGVLAATMAATTVVTSS